MATTDDNQRRERPDMSFRTSVTIITVLIGLSMLIAAMTYQG